MRLRHPFLIALVATLTLGPSLAAAETYKIDSEHATVVFRVSHLNIGDAYGRFNEPTGTVVYDNADPSKTQFNFEVKTDNIDTDNEKRDKHLKSPDFFDARQVPTITFKSTSVKASGDNKFEVTGDLTLHGVTKTITVPVTKTGEADTGKMGYRTGWLAEAKIKRSDFGMTYGIQQGAIGDEVSLVISFEAVRS